MQMYHILDKNCKTICCTRYYSSKGQLKILTAIVISYVLILIRFTKTSRCIMKGKGSGL